VVLVYLEVLPRQSYELSKDLSQDNLTNCMYRMLLVWSAVWLGLLAAPSSASRKYLNYTGDIMLGALFPIHHKGSRGVECGRIQVSFDFYAKR
jgi:hypothetical protein